jgi:hypothetical protein
MLYALYQSTADLMLPDAHLGRRCGPRALRWRRGGQPSAGGRRRALRDDEPGGAQPSPAGRSDIDSIRSATKLGAGAARRRLLGDARSAPAALRKECRRRSPRVLVVQPLSGHFATLLRDTVRVLLPEHDVYVTDWANARDVGVWARRFGFDEYIEHLILFLETMGPGAHCVAVCSPACRRWPRRRSWPRTTIRHSRAA